MIITTIAKKIHTYKCNIFTNLSGVLTGVEGSVDIFLAGTETTKRKV